MTKGEGLVHPRWKFGVLVDPGATGEPPVRLELGPDTDAEVAARVLTELFDTDLGTDGVVLVVGGEEIGQCTRDRLRELSRPAGSRGTFGDGDGASLPGRSTKYTLLRFRCTHCTDEARVLFLDDDGPECRNGHGPMARES